MRNNPKTYTCKWCEAKQTDRFTTSLTIVAQTDEGVNDGTTDLIRFGFCSADCLIHFLKYGTVALTCVEVSDRLDERTRIVAEKEA